MRKQRVMGLMGICIVTLVLLVPRYAIAATIDGAWGDGRTGVDTVVCSATTRAAVPDVLDIDKDDTVRIHYNVSWSDTRPAQSSVANHEYNQEVKYQGYTWNDPYWKNTTGAESNDDGYYRDVTNVQENTYIFINWTVSIVSSNPSCSASDTKSAQIYLA